MVDLLEVRFFDTGYTGYSTTKDLVNLNSSNNYIIIC